MIIGVLINVSFKQLNLVYSYEYSYSYSYLIQYRKWIFTIKYNIYIYI